MATTSPDKIYSPDAGQQYALTQDLLAMADSVQGALVSVRARGTSAQRNSLYGSPVTAAEQVALANAGATWLNTETGVRERYYATSGTAGLIVMGLAPGYSAGWYPEPGSFLYSRRNKTNGSQATGTGGISEPVMNAALSINVGGFGTSGVAGIAVPFSGWYEVTGQIYWSGPAAGSVITHLLAGGPVLSQSRSQKSDGNDITSLATANLRVSQGTGISLGGQPSGATVSMVGTDTNFVGTYISVRYLSPPLGS